ncbi:MAG: Hpt domain-containing protein, partial [Fibrobacteria bacterium]
MDAGSAGFFILNLDGTVTNAKELAELSAMASRKSANDEGSRRDTSPRLPITAVLGLNPEQGAQFAKWLDLVAKRHKDMRWEKLASLAPAQEIRNGQGGDEGPVRLAYRKLEDGQGGLAAIAVFAIDSAPSRAMVRQLEEERMRHRLEVRDVLALAANPPETVGAFLEDARMRLDDARMAWDEYLYGGKDKGSGTSGLWQVDGCESAGQHLFRELHMVKGNAGAFGFESLAAGAQESEDLLEALKDISASPDRTTARLTSSLTGLRSQLDELQRAMKLIAGEGQDAMARILKWKLDRLVASTGGINLEKLEPALRTILEATRKLPFLSPSYLVRKYRNLV